MIVGNRTSFGGVDTLRFNRAGSVEVLELSLPAPWEDYRWREVDAAEQDMDILMELERHDDDAGPSHTKASRSIDDTRLSIWSGERRNIQNRVVSTLRHALSDDEVAMNTARC